MNSYNTNDKAISIKVELNQIMIVNCIKRTFNLASLSTINRTSTHSVYERETLENPEIRHAISSRRGIKYRRMTINQVLCNRLKGEIRVLLNHML